MAQKRMIDKRISVSDQVANLDVRAQLIFTWSIIHADDLGLLPHSHRTLRALVVPMWDIAIEEFSKLVDSIIEQGLLQNYDFGGQKFLRIPNFCFHQTLKRDRNPVTTHQKVKTWRDAEALGFLSEDKGFQTEDDGNPREEKGTEEKGTEEKNTEQGVPKTARGKSDKVKKAKAEMQNFTVTGGKKIADLMERFKPVNPSVYLLYGNKTQRKALDRMIHEHGEEQMRLVIEILPEVNGAKYSGLSITTPVQLENNLGKLLAYVKKRGDSGKGKGMID